jgi:hypothetical protein
MIVAPNKGQKIDTVLKDFVKRWNATHKDFRVDMVKHPKNKMAVIVLQNKDKKNRRDSDYKGECSSGFIQFSIESARVVGVPKVRRKS